jgi:hypothetical protein
MDYWTSDMLHIKTLDNGASIKFSEYTGKWYVEASIETYEDGVLTGGTEHTSNPAGAVHAYFEKLKAIDLSARIDGKMLRTPGGGGHADYWYWNGVAFQKTEKPS